MALLALMRTHLRKTVITVAVLAAAVAYYFCLPVDLFDDPYSPVLQARGGELLSASIASDGQWRFPPSAELSRRYTEALVLFEDRRFYHHPGVDLLSLGRAFRQNLKAGKIVSGGSTISMQVVRLSRKGRSRSIYEKIIEIILATRLELRYTKAEILSMYAAHAPFGGNVVGIQAACWRYFGRGEKELSWGEAALLAVLPNSPALIHPGRNRRDLQVKRDLLLDKLFTFGKIDSITCGLAKTEPLPEHPVQLPRYARHLLNEVARKPRPQKVVSTIDYELQQTVEDILSVHHVRLKGNHIHNAAVLVAAIDSGEILAYVGNVGSDTREGIDVDIIRSPRSTGSILKPFLYAAMLDEGKILPGTLLPDIPTFINGFTPKNFSRDFDGAVPADRAIVRSLNIPAVYMLKDYRYERFHGLLKRLGMRTLTHSPDHYGLSLILGGAEGTLWDITGMYASLARILNRYHQRLGANRYDANDSGELRYVSGEMDKEVVLGEAGLLSAGSIFQTFETLTELHRPGEESGWRFFESARKIAWKTGTSFGFRDGWAVGVTPDYVVGVWVGNADGEGRPGLTGTDAAAPVLFDVFSRLGGRRWFTRPQGEMDRISVCRKSGHRRGQHCPDADTLWVVQRGVETLPCPFHQKVHLTPDKRYQINTACSSISDMVVESWFVLPPILEHYYRNRNISYKPLPPFRPDCPTPARTLSMELIYPRPGSRVFVPRSLSGKPGNVIFQLAHRNTDTTVFWHIDGEYVGSTRKSHQLPVNPPPGMHKLTVLDESGAVVEQEFEVLSGL